MAKGICLKCGKTEEVTKGAILVKCWRCAMEAADMVETRRKKASTEYDWRKTFLSIKHKYQLDKQSTLAFAIGLSPSMLTMVKQYKRPMPDFAMKNIREKYSECLCFKNRDLQGKVKGVAT